MGRDREGHLPRHEAANNLNISHCRCREGRDWERMDGSVDEDALDSSDSTSAPSVPLLVRLGEDSTLGMRRSTLSSDEDESSFRRGRLLGSFMDEMNVTIKQIE